MKHKKIFLVVLGVLILAGAAYAATKVVYFQQKPAESTVEKPKETAVPPASPETVPPQQEQKQGKVKTLLFLKKSDNEQVTELRKIDLDGSNNKLVFTDADEDFKIRIVGGLSKDYVLVFGTPLNETSGSIWQVKIDGSGTKKMLADGTFSTSSFSFSNEKIAFISYDNIRGTYNIWTMNMDGRFKTKVLESEDMLSDLVFADNSLGFVKVDKDGNSIVETMNLDGSNPKEIIKSKDQIYALSFTSGTFAYIKSPKATGRVSLTEVYIYNLSEKKEKKITNDKESDTYPVISKDGTKVVFSKNGKIWVENVDGTEAKVLTEGTQPLGFLE